jgi:hypothetical protein
MNACWEKRGEKFGLFSDLPTSYENKTLPSPLAGEGGVRGMKRGGSSNRDSLFSCYRVPHHVGIRGFYEVIKMPQKYLKKEDSNGRLDSKAVL